MHQRSTEEAADPSAHEAPLSLLGSAAAHDMLWYHRKRGAAFGFRAASLEGGGGGAPVETAGRLHDQRIRLLREDSAREATFTLRPLDEERRIRKGLERISPDARETLRIAYEAKVHDANLHNELGIMADVAFYLPVTREAYAHYCEKFLAGQQRERAATPTVDESGAALRSELRCLRAKLKEPGVDTKEVKGRIDALLRELGMTPTATSNLLPLQKAPYSMETWLCVVAKSNAPLLNEIRDRLEFRVRSALCAYAITQAGLFGLLGERPSATAKPPRPPRAAPRRRSMAQFFAPESFESQTSS